MKRIKVKFVDQWYGHKPEKDKFFQLLCKHYDVELSNTPDYLFDGGLGHEHLKYDCIKILSVGENLVADFNNFDYAVGFDHFEFMDRYVRVPLYFFSDEFAQLSERHRIPPKESLVKRKFCSYVVSNGRGADPLRETFFHRLSKYKRVDSGGRFMNNVGGPVPDKNEFCRQYKFNIASENSCSPGYTTEKVMQPLTYFSIPIYYGNPMVDRDFDLGCMVHVAGPDDVERAVTEIIRLDKDDDEYIRRATAPCLVQPIDYYEKLLERFLVHIIDQPLSDARRLNIYGFQPTLRARVARLYKLEDALRYPVRLLRKLKWF